MTHENTADLVGEEVRDVLEHSGLARHERGLVLALYDTLRDRSEGDRRLVFDALGTRLELEATDEKQQIALRALQRVREREGALPSWRGYKKFRDSQPDPLRWPSPSTIMRAFGGWERALAAAGDTPVADVIAMRAVRAPRNSIAIDPVVLLEAIGEWAAETEEALTVEGFLNWCADRPAPADARSRLPLSK